MSDTPNSPSTPTLSLFISIIIGMLFLLKGNTINVECVGCLYDPKATSETKAEINPPLQNTETVIEGRKPAEVEYDCNYIILPDFRNPPVSPTITPELLANAPKFAQVLAKFASDQRQFRYDYQRHVRDMIDTHNTVCK